jgi:uncharacterized protein
VVPDFTKVTGFQWDSGNWVKNLTKHRVTVQEAEAVFADPNVKVLDDLAHWASEPRWKVFGITALGRYLVVSFTVWDSLVRVISARPMNRKERKIYAEKTAI